MMNKEQAKQKLHNLAFPELGTVAKKLKLVDVLDVVDQIDKPKKVVIPKVVSNWLEACKEDGDGLRTAIEDGIKHIPGEISGWLSSRRNQDIFARAWLDGYEIEKEPLGVLLVDMPKPSLWNYYYLASMWTEPNKEYHVNARLFVSDVLKDHHTIKITESEAKEKYPNFKWVSLEELE